MYVPFGRLFLNNIFVNYISLEIKVAKNIFEYTLKHIPFFYLGMLDEITSFVRVSTEFYTECVLDVNKLNLVKLSFGGSILSVRHFLLLPQLPQKMTLNSKIIISLC